MSSERKDLSMKEGLELIKKQIENPTKPKKKDDDDDLWLPEISLVVTSEEERDKAEARAAKLEAWVNRAIDAMLHNLKRVWIFLGGDAMYQAANLGEFRKVARAVNEVLAVENPVARQGAVDAYANALIQTA